MVKKLKKLGKFKLKLKSSKLKQKAHKNLNSKSDERKKLKDLQNQKLC